MIYVCVPTYNEAETVGILLWKIRKVFAEFPREYHILLLDDGSTDATAEVVEPYKNVLPLTVSRHDTRRGYAAAAEALLRRAAELTDRPKRDSIVLMQADFSHDADRLPEFVKRLESGADLVVGEGGLRGVPAWYRWLRRWGAKLYRQRVSVPGVEDVASGYFAARLVSVRNALGDGDTTLTTSEHWAANAELQGRIGQRARRVASVEADERHDLRRRPTRISFLRQLQTLWRERRAIVMPEAPTPPTQRPHRRRRRKTAA